MMNYILGGVVAVSAFADVATIISKKGNTFMSGLVLGEGLILGTLLVLRDYLPQFYQF